jgi:hypothetical protein
MGDSIFGGPPLISQQPSRRGPEDNSGQGSIMVGPEYGKPAEAPASLPLPPREDPFERQVQERLPQAVERLRGRQQESAVAGVELPYGSPSGYFPIISPLLRRGASAVESAFTGKPYEDVLAGREAEHRAYEIVNPTRSIIDRAQGVLGGVATTPVTKFGAKLFGAPIEAAAYGAAEGAANIRPGETPEEMRKRVEDEALQGGVFGLGARVAAPIIGRIADIPRSFSENAKAARELASSVLTQRGKQGPLTPEQYNMLRDAGYPVLPVDVRGAADAAARAGSRSEEGIRDLNEILRNRVAASDGVAQGHLLDISKLRGTPTLDVATLSDAAKRAKEAALSGPYQAAYGMPNAQNLPIPDWILNSPQGQEAIKNASHALGYKSGNTFSDTGPFIRNSQTGNLELPAGGTLNLEFLDHVKRSLNEQTEQIAKSSPTLARYIGDRLGTFVDDLRVRVPEYGAVLDTAGNYLRGKNAFDDGYEFYNLMRGAQGSGASSAANARDYSQQLFLFANKYTPQERALFQEGILSRAYQNPGEVSKYITNLRPQQLDGLRAIMGRDFDPFYNSMLVHNTSVTMNNIAAKGGFVDQAKSYLGHAAGLAGNFALLGGNPAAFALQAAIGTGQIYLNRRSAAQAQELLSMAGDPNRVPDMLKLINENPSYRTLLIRLQPFISRMASGSMEASETPDIVDTAGSIVRNIPPEAIRMGRSVYESYQPREQQPPRRAGGRVGRASGGRLMRNDHSARAAALIKAAEAAKKAHNATTEGILEQPDEAVAKALSIANKAI